MIENGYARLIVANGEEEEEFAPVPCSYEVGADEGETMEDGRYVERELDVVIEAPYFVHECVGAIIEAADGWRLGDFNIESVKYSRLFDNYKLKLRIYGK